MTPKNLTNLIVNNLIELIIPLIIIIIFTKIPKFQAQPAIYGYTCNKTTFIPCQTYVLHRPTTPDLLNLASIGDLFNVSRLSISKPSNISNPSVDLSLNQPLFIPVSCNCHPLKNQTLKSISYSPMTYSFNPVDNFYYVSIHYYGNLTTYQSVEVVNPEIVPTDVPVGTDVIFPVFCKCPDKTQLKNNVSLVVSYVFQPDDTVDSVSELFGVSKKSIVDLNGNKLSLGKTAFVPVSKLPKLVQIPGTPPPQNTSSNSNQTNSNQTNSNDKNSVDHKGAAIGLGIGLGICVLLLCLLSGLLVYREKSYRKRMRADELGNKPGGGLTGRGYLKGLEQNLILADVSETLDKYKVYEIEELRNATDGFDDKYLILGSVYKGSMNGKVYAIKKMKWNAYEELKILQKETEISEAKSSTERI